MNWYPEMLFLAVQKRIGAFVGLSASKASQKMAWVISMTHINIKTYCNLSETKKKIQFIWNYVTAQQFYYYLI